MPMMAKSRAASDLKHRVAFDKRAEVDDGYGNTVGTWQEQFKVWAGFTHLRGGETIMASRLQNQHPMVVCVRSSSQTRQVTAEWRMRDLATGEEHNIRDITPTEDREWLDFLTMGGVATG
jgi:SPP1 family predicted phage head-tail adaptor